MQQENFVLESMLCETCTTGRKCASIVLQDRICENPDLLFIRSNMQRQLRVQVRRWQGEVTAKIGRNGES